jgi:hypothetical protein
MGLLRVSHTWVFQKNLGCDFLYKCILLRVSYFIYVYTEVIPFLFVGIAPLGSLYVYEEVHHSYMVAVIVL